MREAVIVSTARTPIGRAGRGSFNDTDGQELIGHAIKHAVERSGLRGLNEGQKISYDLEADRKTGKSAAVNLKTA